MRNCCIIIKSVGIPKYGKSKSMNAAGNKVIEQILDLKYDIVTIIDEP